MKVPHLRRPAEAVLHAELAQRCVPGRIDGHPGSCHRRRRRDEQHEQQRQARGAHHGYLAALLFGAERAEDVGWVGVALVSDCWRRV